MTVVIAGCGDLGTEAGLRFAAAGHRVLGLRRRPELLPSAIEGRRIDLARDIPEIPADTDIVVLALTPDTRSVDGYRHAYLDAPAHLLAALEQAGARPRRILLVSSTSVWGDIDDGRVLDESSPVAPRPGTGEIVYAGECLVRLRAPDAIVLRLSGLYGPGRGRLLRQVRDGVAHSGPDRYTNRIHRDDAAAIVHLTSAVAEPRRLYLGSDCEPAVRSDVAEFLAAQRGVLPADAGTPSVDESAQHDGRTPLAGKQLTNARLRESGFRFAYPTYREGYAHLLSAEGARHP
ncbi:hypothetical protein [Tomitella biformata]|uniref:hypothetical protein n=1 Tax=Tomitella biformata TaxID=630403 RepID=UPI000462F9FD|nr:hypothetical protein [Tomitella biformata]